MNKAELIGEVSSKTGLTKKDTADVLDAMTETIADTLSQGEKVALVGFGTFRIPAKRVPEFVPGKSLREKVKGGN
ncbi:DNA-binding protein HU [subsurface metagenome]